MKYALAIIIFLQLFTYSVIALNHKQMESYIEILINEVQNGNKIN
jgi:preprotein translocase subunit YajC